jgi:hypothetical protein
LIAVLTAEDDCLRSCLCSRTRSNKERQNNQDSPYHEALPAAGYPFDPPRLAAR